MTNLDPRAWDDKTLESVLTLPSLTGAEPGSALGHLFTDVIRELARRADIRINRGEYGGHHDATWYEPRPVTVEDTDAYGGYTTGEPPEFRVPSTDTIDTWNDALIAEGSDR